MAKMSVFVESTGVEDVSMPETDAILEPVDEKYLSASAASSRRAAAVVPVLVVCAS